MAELIVLQIGIGFANICAIHAIGDAVKRQAEIIDIEQIIKEREDRKNKFALALKREDKYRFINKFIDEIPELSYYEAAQLKKKLGNIYLEWNDE
jgi:hypothetical protein